MNETYPDGFTITKSGKVKVNQDSNTYHPFGITFDFTGATLTQVAEIAVRGMVIDRQRKYRTDLGKGVKPVPETVNVLASATQGRIIVVVTKVDVQRHMASMTDEELEEALAERIAAREMADETDETDGE